MSNQALIDSGAFHSAFYTDGLWRMLDFVWCCIEHSSNLDNDDAQSMYLMGGEL